MSLSSIRSRNISATKSVKESCRKGRSHLAFVGNSRLCLFTVPPIKKLEGKNVASLDPEWLPVVVQAGTYSGVTSVVYASNGWLDGDGALFRKGIVRFYLIRA